MKVCSICNIEKSNDSFFGERCQCKACRNKMRREKRKAAKPVAVVTRVSGNPWESLGMEWRGHVPHDPYSNSNRHGGVRV